MSFCLQCPQNYHAACVHDSVSKGVREVPAESIDGPVVGSEVGVVRTPDSQVLYVPPVHVGVGLQDQGYDAGCHGGRGRGAGVRGGAVVVKICRHHFALSRRAGAVSGGKGARTRLRIPVRKTREKDRLHIQVLHEA